MIELLRKIGLSEGEIKVYSAILDLGRSPINKIHEKTGIERRNIYDIINKLIEKGLISYEDENKKRTFRITHPNKILGYLEEKKKEIENSKSEIEQSLPQIISKFNSKKPNISSQTFRGEEGIKAVWDDMLNYKVTYWIGGGRYVPKKYPNFFIPWNKKRIQKKIVWENLVRHELRGEFKIMPYENAKFLPIEFSGSPTVIAIFGNKVAQFVLGDYIFAVVIESKELADNYKRYHKYLWDNVAKN